MKATITNFALAVATLFSFAGSVNAQAPAESLFDSIEASSTNRGQMAQPQLRTAPEFERAPNVDPRSRTAPQSFTQQPAIQQSVPAIQGPEPRYVQPAPRILPPTCNKLPKLQFSGREIHGVGMQVVAVDYGGVAQQIGLEPGDIIVQIDGRAITCSSDYENALWNAAIYNDGHVDLVVRNVRYRPGCTINRQYVTIHADLPTRCYVPEIVASR